MKARNVFVCLAVIFLMLSFIDSVNASTMSTPEKTISTTVEAINNNDWDAWLNCFLNRSALSISNDIDDYIQNIHILKSEILKKTKTSDSEMLFVVEQEIKRRRGDSEYLSVTRAEICLVRVGKNWKVHSSKTLGFDIEKWIDGKHITFDNKTIEEESNLDVLQDIRKSLLPLVTQVITHNH
jgi:hypothetical protein